MRWFFACGKSFCAIATYFLIGVMWAGIYLAVIIAVLVGRYMSMEEEKYIEREITPPQKK